MTMNIRISKRTGSLKGAKVVSLSEPKPYTRDDFVNTVNKVLGLSEPPKPK